MRAFAEASIGCALRVALDLGWLGAGHRDSADSGDFPDTPLEYPDPADFSLIRGKNSLFCCLGNLPRRSAESLGFSAARTTLRAVKIAKFPVLFPVSREFGVGDGFARDWPLRHPVCLWPAFLDRAHKSAAFRGAVANEPDWRRSLS